MLASKYTNAKNTTQMLSILAAISESNDKEFIRSVVTKIKMYNYPISGTGVHVISVILSHCQRLEEMTLHGCSIDDTIGSIFWETAKDCDIRVKAIDLSSNKLSEKTLSVVGNIIETDGRLHLLNCSITSTGLQRLKTALGCKKVLNLKLSNNELTEESLSVIGEIVQHECHLELNYCLLTSSKLESLKRALGDKTVKKLDLEGNNLSDDALSVVGCILQNNNQLGLKKCSFTGSGMESLSKALGDKKVKELILENNILSDGVLSSVGCLIRNNGVLNLDNCWPNNSGMRCLKTAIGFKKLKKLNLSWNELSCEILLIVGHIIQHEGHLDLRNCWVNSSDLQSLKKALGDKKIQELNLSFKPGIFDDFSAVAHIMQNDGILRSQACPLSSVDFTRLKTALGKKKVTILEGGFIELSDKTIPDLIRKLEVKGEINLREYSVTRSGLELLKKELGDKTAKLLKLDGNRMPDKILSIVGQIIRNNGLLFLQRCSLSSSGLQHLKAALGDKKISLYLYGNDEIDQSLDAAGAILADRGELSLGSCKLSTSGLQRLSNSLGNKQISYLNISSNAIDQEMALVVGKMTKKLFLDRLWMMECSLTNEALRNILSEAIGSKVSRVDISENAIDQEMALTVGKITKYLSIKRLEMRNCSLTEKALNNFLLAAKGSELSHLGLEKNHLSEVAVAQIRPFISVNNIADSGQRKAE